jgi:hypothetical protein
MFTSNIFHPFENPKISSQLSTPIKWLKGMLDVQTRGKLVSALIVSYLLGNYNYVCVFERVINVVL